MDNIDTQLMSTVHPAEHIYGILSEVHAKALEQHNKGRSLSMLDIWSLAFNLPGEQHALDSCYDTINVMKFWQAQVSDNIELPESKRNAQLRLISRILPAVQRIPMYNSAQFIQALSEDAVNSLELISDTYDYRFPGIDETLSDVVSQTDQLIDRINESLDLDEVLKRALLQALYHVLDVIKNFRIYGVQGLEGAAERNIGTFFTHADLVASATKTSDEARAIVIDWVRIQELLHKVTNLPNRINAMKEGLIYAGLVELAQNPELSIFVGHIPKMLPSS